MAAFKFDGRIISSYETGPYGRFFHFLRAVSMFSRRPCGEWGYLRKVVGGAILVPKPRDVLRRLSNFIGVF